MKKFLIFLLGLIVGIGGAWIYYTSIAAPRLVTQTEVLTKEKFEQSQIEKQMFLSATVTAISGNTIEAVTEKNDQEQTITIIVSASTKITAQANDDSATKNPIVLSELTPGSVITVVTSGIIDLIQPIDAIEIIKL
ncbi:MAG: hypothetical protein Q7R62_01710 [bacterium]|nr:hypothetical protein [bacterium]